MIGHINANGQVPLEYSTDDVIADKRHHMKSMTSDIALPRLGLTTPRPIHSPQRNSSDQSDRETTVEGAESIGVYELV
jgi:hypothetical protein